MRLNTKKRELYCLNSNSVILITFKNIKIWMELDIKWQFKCMIPVYYFFD